jgi:hypothetical protein
MSKIGTLAASTTTTIELPYCPAVIHFDASTVPTDMKVNVLGDGVVCDLDGAGIAAASRMFRVGNLADQYFIVIANGLVRKNTKITITNAVAGTVDVYGYSERNATYYVQSLQQKCFQNSNVPFANFLELALPDMTGNDKLTVNYRAGFTDDIAPNDLRVQSSVTTYTDDTDSDYRLRNLKNRIGGASFLAAADQQVYLFRIVALGNV